MLQGISRVHEVQKGRLTVGSDPTSVVTPAVSPTWLLSLFWKTQWDVAGSATWQVRQVNIRVLVVRSSFG